MINLDTPFPAPNLLQQKTQIEPTRISNSNTVNTNNTINSSNVLSIPPKATEFQININETMISKV